ncbi:hypothetical protein STSP2_02844 [Anaerohalosphaera lusitana]|uniref:DUF1570 domain-containing protein n=1 Tax=Anaerohalosphaera lusitana TaxID=1936003 RepID=A0A1U9NPW3_9BACT|nr:hypothetical protein [Anaerohalosphaera lusitana]AQT69650.1 hypothetical protein STSP2_02844 [Anaerohalosphaera lusitana]
MKTKFVTFAVLALAILAMSGCSSQTGPRHSTSQPMTTPAGMIEYLDCVPALQNAQVWQNSYSDGLILNTEHYKVYTTLLDPLMLRQVPAFLESAHREYQKQTPATLETHSPFVIYLFKDREQWENFTKEFTGKQSDLYLKIQRGAYYLNGACVAYNIGRSRTFSVLGHEGWHQFNSRHFTYRLPSWLDEGLATLFEESSYINNRFVFRPNQNLGRLGSLRKTLIDENAIPLKTLLALNPGEVVHYQDSEDVMAFYAQAYALVRFLREDNYGQRYAQFQNLLSDAIEGTWPLSQDEQKIASNRNIPFTTSWNRYVSPKLFNQYIEGEIGLLQKDYSRFCRKIVYNIRLK